MNVSLLHAELLWFRSRSRKQSDVSPWPEAGYRFVPSSSAYGDQTNGGSSLNYSSTFFDGWGQRGFCTLWLLKHKSDCLTEGMVIYRMEMDLQEEEDLYYWRDGEENYREYYSSYWEESEGEQLAFFDDEY